MERIGSETTQGTQRLKPIMNWELLEHLSLESEVLHPRVRMKLLQKQHLQTGLNFAVAHIDRPKDLEKRFVVNSYLASIRNMFGGVKVGHFNVKTPAIVKHGGGSIKLCKWAN